MGGAIEWQALPIIVEMFGIDDVESFIYRLNEIREFKGREQGN